jgi:O-antigen ligase
VTADGPLTIAGATGAERLALRCLQFAAVATALVVSTRTMFDLDRFFVPKELVLHLAAVLGGLLVLRALFQTAFNRIDWLLAGYLILSVLSAAMATNRWLALRALTLSASGVVLFWVARALRDAGLARPLLSALALAVVVAAATSLLQTYGVETQFFSQNRAPGGTLGNRNFIAHAAAFGVPLLFFLALGARHRRARLLGTAGVMMVTAVLVLTRSRAAWLAFAVVLVVLLIGVLLSPALRRDGQTWKRLLQTAVITVAGVAAALAIPNTLHWRSDNPYLESMKRVADYQEGSGHGRLVQYEESLLIAIRHPLFGVGPGNWPVQYPARAARNDPSMNESEGGMTSNPWPSSDWVAWLVERGAPAAVLLALAFLSIAKGGLRQLYTARDAEQGLCAVALLGTVAAALMAGLFDAVLLLAFPALVVWTAAGALSTDHEVGIPAAHPLVSRLIVIAVIALAALGGFRTLRQLQAMEIAATHSDRASLTRAAQYDPGSFRVQLRLARMGGKGRCEHARAARALFPHAVAALDAARGCGR